MTERLYDDGLLLEFDAAVTDVRKTSKGYEIILDRSAFFPEGGGQPGDVGIIGTARVIDTYEQNGQVVHLCTSPLQIGAAVHCSVDEDIRIRRMQGHSGEHLIMGFIHKKLGLDNVGFRLGSSYVTLDLDGEISMDDLRECEQQANLAIAKDIPIRISYPDAEELAKLEYRSKLSVDEGIRIVTIEGIDRCACCAPHFPSTGSIGMVRVLSAQSYKGGTRVYILCGLDALDLFRERTETVTSISVLLSAKPEKTAEAVKKLYDENNALKKRLYDMEKAGLDELLEGMTNDGRGSFCIFTRLSGSDLMRRAANKAVLLTDGAVGVFSGGPGAYSYIIASENIPLKARNAEICTALKAKGGGSDKMLQGSSAAGRDTIERFFENFS